MGGSSKKVTVGYWYGLGLHFGICHGPVDAVTRLQVDDREAWTGSAASGDVSIAQRELFGGEKREGGIEGTLTILGGGPAQGANLYLQSQLGTYIPAFRGVLTAVWRGLVSANNPYLKPWSFTVRRILQGWHGGTAWYSARAAIGTDMNPAHIIYQTHTDPNWGMGYPTSSIDDTNFRAVADTLHAEGFGLSLLWNRQATIAQFQQDILNHIGGIMRNNPRTGLLEIKLLRDDYDPDTLPVFDPSNCTLESYQRAATAEMTNEVTVVYTDATTGKDVPITVQNLAAVQSQGGVINATVAYPGITSATIAARVAERDLRAQSSPLAKVRLRCNRAAWDLLPGDCIRLNWPEQGISNVVYRVINMGLGTLKAGAIIIEASEDVYGLPSASYVEQEPVGWARPGSDPAASPARYVAEAPYFDIVRELSAADLATVAATDCYLSVTSRRPASDAYEPTLWTRTSGGTWTDVGQAQHCPAGVLDGAHAKGATTLTLRNSIDLDRVETGGYLVVGGEFMRVDAISPALQTVTVSPGVLDTVPIAHADGEVVYFVDGFQTSDGIQYATGETVEARIQTQTTRGILPFASAPTDSCTMAGRQARPYPPGNFRINGTSYPATGSGTTIAISWAHRDRLQQTASIIAQSAGNIGPEAGTTYNLRIYDGASLVLSQTGITGTSYTYSPVQTVALLHFDGTNGSTTFTDETGKVWTASGNAQISTAQSQFGGASGLFDGAGDMIATPVTAEFYMSGNFTVEAWVRPASFGNYNTIFADWDSSRGYPMLLGINSSGNLVTFINGSNRLTSSAAIALNTWAHVAWVRNGSTLTVYINGAAAGSATYSAAIGAMAGNAGRIGAADAAANHPFNGHIDELRVSNGVARYAANFTVPGDPFAVEGAGSLPTRTLRVELESVRDGLVSHNTHNHTFTVN